MSLHLYAAFIAAAAALILLPGPNVALIVANSLAHGSRYGLMTVAGTSSAMIVQLAVTILGMTTLLGALANGFGALRWVGVAYLIYLGVKAWRQPPVDLTATTPQRRSVRAIYWRGFFVSLTNPKTLLFYGAFLPQFVTSDGDVTGQLFLLCGTFLALAILLDGAWAMLSARFGKALAINGRLRNRLTGAMLAGAGVGLAFARKS